MSKNTMSFYINSYAMKIINTKIKEKSMLTQESNINEIRRIAGKSQDLINSMNGNHLKSQESFEDLSDSPESISTIAIKLRILSENLQLKFLCS